ncbi:MAG: phospholipid-binding protein [Mesorhizobium sp.]|nr:MAG: phospholipid-binding protein [Mesorhizobium sp.]
MTASFDWGPTKKCFDPKSPPIKVSNVPQGTSTLDIRMTDQNAPDFNHGGGKVAYEGQSQLPYGAFRYKGPCPPDGTHFYRITVKALDSSGKSLSTASATQPFSSK